MYSSRTVALIGSPNSGKTTLYNWLTQSKFKTVNYPGATVEIAVGNSAPRMGTPDFAVIDTPGTYSLFPKSHDEEVTLKVLTQPFRDEAQVNQVILVVDGTQLNRHLVMAKQLQEMKIPFVIVITMADLLEKSKLKLQTSVIATAFNCEVTLFDGVFGTGLEKIGEALRKETPRIVQNKNLNWTSLQFEAVHEQITSLVKKAFGEDQRQKISMLNQQTEKIDNILLSGLWGIPIFFLIMFAVFTSIYSLAAPLQDAIDFSFSFMGTQVKNILPGSLLADFIADGVLTSFSAVLVFTPQIFILFFGIGLLESSGYLARAATLIDRPFQVLGLSGRSFVPLLSGFACAVPAMMATRNLSSSRDRLITNFIIPLMTCSARLPVYSLLLGFLFFGEPAWKAGLAMTAMYFGALLVGAAASLILNKILAGQDKSFFMMELPLYRRPRFNLLFDQSIKKTWSYITRAGPIIFGIAVLIWFGTNFPRNNATQAPEVQESYMGQTGHYLEPAFAPMGLDWRAGVGLISAFAAREVFVSTLALLYQIEGDEDTQQDRLLDSMKSATNLKGDKVFTVGSIIGLLIFFMIALQCMSTVAISIKESGSWKFAITQLILFNVIAYLLAVGANQLWGI